MMHRHAIARVGEGSDFYTLLLPYGSGDKWSMTIFLPKEGKTVSDVVNSLDMSKWSTYAYEYPQQGMLTSNFQNLKALTRPM